MAAAADSELGQLFGVSPVVVLKLREEHLTEGTHFGFDTTGGRRRLCYTPAGIEKLAGLIVPADGAAAAAERKEEGGGALSLPGRGFTLWLPVATPARAMRRLMLPVMRLYPNSIWIDVRDPDGGKLKAVRVRDNRQLRQGQLLLCEENEDGSWECVQPRQAPPPQKRRAGV